MRKAPIFALAVAVVACFLMPLTVLAQTQITAAIGGRSVDAAGRGVSGERVELLLGTQVLNTVTTNGLGEWSFRGVEPGVYVVRMNVRGRIAGVRVTVAAGQVVSGTMIVVPAATASLQLGALANLLTLIPAATATTLSTVAATVQVTETTELSPAILVQILTALPAAERAAFAAAVVAAIKNEPVGAAMFAQYQQQFTQIAANPSAPLPSFPPPVAVS